MAVSVDTVYQRVLTLANKEQRGYITPQEFNLLANQAQMEIFEQYLADLTVNTKTSGNTEEYSDLLSVLYEKIGIFEIGEDATWIAVNMPDTSGIREIPSTIYKIGTIICRGPISNELVHVEILSSKDYDQAFQLPLTSPDEQRPLAKITSKGITIQPTKSNNKIETISFIQRPVKVEWAYVIVNDKALYNDNISVDFQLHASEETELVYKILKLAGINLKAAEIVQVGQALEQTNKQTTT